IRDRTVTGVQTCALPIFEKGLRVPRVVKTSLAPGSRVVTDYYRRSGLQPYLDQLGFYTVGYGCTTCIGNSGPLDPRIEEAITQRSEERRVGKESRTEWET